MKKIISVILSILMVLSVSPLTALAEEIQDTSVDLGNDVSADGTNDFCAWSYDSETKTLTLDGENIVSDDDTGFLPAFTLNENNERVYAYRGFEHLVLGSRVKLLEANLNADNYPLLKSADMSASQLTDITGSFANSTVDEVSLPETLKSIGDNAFTASLLTEISLPPSVTSIGKSAFENCASLVKVEMNGVTVVNDSAFSNCIALKNIVRDSSKEIKIYNDAFYKTSALENACFDNVTALGNTAFCASAVKSVTYNGTSDDLGTGVLKSALNLSSVKVTKATDIYSNFLAYAKVDSVTLGANVKNLENYSFREATIGSLTFECESLDTIGTSAFNGVTYLSDSPLVLPDSIKTVKSYAFKGFSGDIDFEDVYISVIQKYAFSGSGITGIYNPLFEDVSAYAFSDCQKLEFYFVDQINGSDVTTGFDDHVFSNCKNMVEYYDCGESLIGSNEFEGCTSLRNFAAPNLKKLSSGAFSGCTALEGAELGNIAYIPSRAFYGNTALESVNYNNLMLKYIGSSAFEGCVALTDIRLDNVQSIYDRAFALCTSLGDVVSLPGTTDIGESAFESCNNITGFKLGEYLSSVSDYAFKNCKNLRGVTFSPQSIDFGENIFDGCKSLEWVKFRGADYGMPEAFASMLPSDLIFYCGKGTTPEAYATNNNITVKYITVEVPLGAKTSGTLDGGTWLIKDETLFIYGAGDGKLGNDFYFVDGTKTNITTLKSMFTVNNIELLGDITSIPDKFLYATRLDKLTTLVIPSTVKSIGDEAFNYLLSKDGFDVVLNEDLESVGYRAFAKSDAKSIDTSKCTADNITFGDEAFCGITALTEFTFPQGLKDIPNSALAGDSGITQITFNAQTSIGDKAFYNTGIKEIVLPSEMKTVGKGAFTACKNLSSITVNSVDTEFSFVSIISPENSAGYDEKGSRYNTLTIKCDPLSKAHEYAVKALVDFAPMQINYASFGYVSSIKNDCSAARWFYYPEEKTLLITGNSVASGSFYDASYNPVTFDDVETVRFFTDVGYIGSGWSSVNPKYVYFSDRADTIAARAFSGCTRLVAVNIPDSVLNLDESAFEGCTGLKSVTIGKGVQHIPQYCFRGCISLQDLNIKGAVSIAGASFKNCSKLVTINLPDTLKYIYSTAFINCYSVVTINLGKNLQRIDEYAFANLPFCDEININSNLVAVRKNAFYNTGLSTTGITINYLDNATKTSLAGFDDSNIAVLKFSKNFDGIVDYGRVPQLRDIVVEDGNVNGYTSYQHALYKDNTLVLAPQNTSTLQIRADTTKIGAYAVRYNKLSIAVIPDGVTEIGEDAFADSDTLKAVKFPKTIEIICDRAFENCTRIKTVNIPDSLTSLGARAFYNCSTLAAVVLPEGLTEIKSECFNCCKSIVNMVVPRSVTTIGGGAFSNMTSLEKVYIWNSSAGYRMLYNSNNAVVYTLAGSPAYAFAKNNKYQVKGYTDEEVFAEECFAAVDSLEGYLGYCNDGHGDIEWLTVYEPDCENDGYRIGVCEYCSTILDEEHITATGHEYHQVAYIKETETQRGIRVLKCSHCGETRTTYTNPTSSEKPAVGVYNVKGVVQADTKRSAYYGENFGIENVNVVIDGNVVARTNEDGEFSFNMKSGTYAVDLVYSFGFTRTVALTITDHDVRIAKPIKIVACDFNKDGVIDSADQNLFRIIVSSKKGDAAYLSYVDLNHDGCINAKDYLIIQSFVGAEAASYEYPELNLA